MLPVRARRLSGGACMTKGFSPPAGVTTRIDRFLNLLEEILCV